MFSNFKIEPYQYQKVGSEFAARHRYCIIGDEMGLGKTLQAIVVSSHFSKRTLIVCPSYLKLNWSTEFDKFCEGKAVTWVKTKTDMWTAITHAESKVIEKVRPISQVVIINYEMLDVAKQLFQWADMVVADEAHYLKNLDAKRTELFHNYIYDYRPNRLMLLTGTPIKNKVDEFYSLLCLCSYDLSKSNGLDITEHYPTIWAFRNHFMKSRPKQIGYRTITEYYGHKNIDELKKYLKHKYLRRLATQVLELPSLIGKMVMIKDKKSKEIEQMWEDFEVAKPSNFSAAKAASAAYKAPFTIKYAKDILDQGESVVIFTDHVDSCDLIATGLKKYGSGAIKGGVSVEARQKIIDDFQCGVLRAIVLTIGAGSTGITLTKARNLIFNDVSWVPGDNWQAMKRIHRIGQNEKCVIHYMIASSIDARIVSKVKTKKKTLEAVL